MFCIFEALREKRVLKIDESVLIATTSTHNMQTQAVGAIPGPVEPILRFILKMF